MSPRAKLLKNVRRHSKQHKVLNNPKIQRIYDVLRKNIMKHSRYRLHFQWTGNNPMVGATVACAVAVEEAMNK